MAIYDPKSMKAEEFINDAEIRETIAYANANKNNIELIDALLEKARPKTERLTALPARDLPTGRRACCLRATSPKR